MQSVYGCIDTDDPMVAWNAYRGILVSAQAGNKYPKCPTPVMLAGMLKHRNSARLGNELVIERVRQLKYSTKVSRLAGMYFFEDPSGFEVAREWGGHFAPEYQAELGLLPGATVSRHDANWITHAPLDSSGCLKSVDWADPYWSGEPFPNQTPVWELIVDGRAAVYGTELRQRAYATIKAEFPECVAILEVGRISAVLGSDLGQISSWLKQASEAEFSLQYYVDMRDAQNSEFLERVRNYDGPKNHADLAVGGDEFSVPDLRSFGESFHTNEQFPKQFLAGVHANKT
ncbi:hypothetical protein [Marinobacter goseongensis]|uniref:hypothetical protein n=1 Tax=Marinobacter goseongensis TaxID=453838 RepID=UPI002006AA17|nr:hypothetical protein [Marinobacter goseongensis]MCK7553427.1 hypothetical protein [Marinobacter goseongensis]